MTHRSRRIAVSVALLVIGGLFVIFLPRIGAHAQGNGKSANPLQATPTLTHSAAQEPVKEPVGVISGASYHNDTSPNLRDMKQIAMPIGRGVENEANENPKVPHKHVDSPDPVVQKEFVKLKSLTSLDIPSPILNFDGIVFPGVGCNCAPPYTNGEIGQTQYVQMVNEGYQVFNKTTGASLLGPASITSLWAGFGGPCELNGDGDPVVIYDQIANRWVISQFAGTPIPTSECIAVSTTSDATGSYNRYGFLLGTNFFDYPHLSVWPNAYYMSMNVFNAAGTAFLGPQPFAFDRAKMLLGQPATFVSTGITNGPNEDTYLPADLDGSTQPPANAPGTFVEMPFTGTYRVFHFQPNFVTPASSTFTLFASPASAAFTELCPTTRACVPQLGSTGNLDGIGDRLMFRLATRFLAGHESTVGNFSVSSGGVSGVRWFELRGATAGPVTVFQESTYQPDTTWRWMGSTAMDQGGNMAVGFSASSSTINPQIRYAGRLAGDPINTLAQGEATLFAGTGSQTGTGNRWGDYSDLTIDPVDDCTFWYTQEYYSTTSSFNWRTRIGNFKFTQCSSVPTPVIVPAGSTLVNESCPPTNSAIDPGETVTVRLDLMNAGTGPTTNLVATLQSNANVLAPSAPQTYGAMAVNSTVGRDFTFTAAGNCGDIITLTLQLQDGANNLGTVTFTRQLGTTVVSSAFTENFDGVVAPALPPGWTTAATGVEVPWVTSTTNPSSAPNDAFAPDPSNIGNTELVSPSFAVAAGGGQLTFRNLYNMESTFDGMVLEISINGGAFQDITMGGGSFASGGYNGTISTAFGSPIAGRPAWTGLSGGTTAAPTYITTVANLPAAAAGQNVQLKWRAATDNSVSAAGAAGVRVDTVSVSSTSFSCNTACQGSPRIGTSTVLSCSGSNKVATITITNSGTATANNVMLTTATLGGVSGTPLPQTVGTLAPGASSVKTVTFVGAPSGMTTLVVGGTFTGGTYSSSRKVNAPVCNTAMLTPALPYLPSLPALLAAVVSPSGLTGR